VWIVLNTYSMGPSTDQYGARNRYCLELGAGDLSERTQLEELEEDVHFVFR
jgi:hypothetical protein